MPRRRPSDSVNARSAASAKVEPIGRPDAVVSDRVADTGQDHVRLGAHGIGDALADDAITVHRDSDAGALLEQGHHVGAVLPQPVLYEPDVPVRRCREGWPDVDNARGSQVSSSSR